MPVVAYFESLAADAADYDASSPNARRLGSNVNTAYSDFSPYRYADRLYFTSAHTDKVGQVPVNQIFSSVQSSPPVLWSENSNEAGKNTSHIALSPDGKRVYYTVCEETAKGGQQCEIYTRERAFEGHWLPFRRLPRSINADGYTATQPSIGFDYHLRKEVLYFVSDRPGGKGGLDVWCSPIEANGTYGTPFSMPFNSPQDDVTPFAYQQGRSLFFSSNRQGGSFDIFKIMKKGADWATPTRLNEPFNSDYDDLYFSCHQASGRAYFSSNRPGCRTVDSTQTCIGYDIFEAPILTELKVQVLVASSDVVKYDATVQVVDRSTGAVVSQGDAGKHQFFVQPGQQYQMSVAAPGYAEETIDLETTASDALSTLERKVRLRQNTKLAIEAFSALDSLPLVGVAFAYATENGPQPIMNQGSGKGNEYILMVAFGEKLNLEATKQGFKPASVNLDLSANGPSAAINLQVYLQPFANLPIALYFDNDQPRWLNPTDNESKLTYEQTLNDYLARKPIFVEKYTEGLAQEGFEAARQKMLSFFEDEVVQGLRGLDELCAQIEPYLMKGYRLEILTEGQASPLASFDYNKQLSERRVSSIRNYLKVWRGGALKSYLYSGKLSISTKFTQLSEPVAAPEAVLAADRRSVEFSPEASMMRRIVILEVRVQPNKV